MTAPKVHDDAPSPAARELLRRRADALRAIPPELQDEERVTWVAVCRLGDASFAFLLSSLRGILPLGMVTPVPLAGPNIVGVTRFQGQLVTVLSLATLLGGRAWAKDPTNLLVLEHDDGLIALDCMDVPRTVPLEAEPGAVGAADGLLVPVSLVGGERAWLVDVARLLEGASGADRHPSGAPPSGRSGEHADG